MKATLLLEDGLTLSGNIFALGSNDVCGEVVFNTCMSGYQELTTDPSYKGQILTFTYPLIGNYGCHPDYNESKEPGVKAVIIKEYCSKPQNWRSKESFGDYLERFGILGIEGIDTRTLTLHLRRFGTMRGVISTANEDTGDLMKKLKSYPITAEPDLVQQVTTKKPYIWDKYLNQPSSLDLPPNTSKNGKHVVVVDLGVKYSTLRALSVRGCRITVVPSTYSQKNIMALEPDGVLLSNGPGDPAALDYLLPEVRSLMGQTPLMGISMGHQVMGRALGIETYKLPFGHRGSNHPVKELSTGRVFITVQNHGFNLNSETTLPKDTNITHENLNDKTVEGLENKEMGFFSVQFNPETNSGPHNNSNLFDRFINMI